MAIPRFYGGPEKLVCGTVRMSAEEARHAQTSRRLRAGDEVIVFDGQGGEGRGRLSVVDRQILEIRLEAVDYRAQDTHLQVTIAASLPKGPRQDVLIEKCTELGVAAIWPVRCERSIVRPSGGRIEKLRRTAIEACKQSQRAWLPQITSPLSFDEVLLRAPAFGKCLIADRSGDAAALDSARAHDSVLVMIGPEGGFTDGELSAARSAGFAVAALGVTLLRTETAAIAAAARLLTG